MVTFSCKVGTVRSEVMASSVMNEFKPFKKMVNDNIWRYSDYTSIYRSRVHFSCNLGGKYGLGDLCF